MKISEDLKEQVISASLEYTSDALSIAGEYLDDSDAAKVATENQRKLQEYTTALEVAEVNGDELEARILRNMIEDFKVVELARLELNRIEKDRESREALFTLLQSAALKSAKIAISAAVIA